MGATEAASNLVRLEALERIRSELQERDIRILYLKGAAFLDTIYPELDRPMVDVDLLIRERDLERTGHALGELGFSEIDLGDMERTRSASLDRYYARFFRRGAIVLDVHHRFCHADQFDVDYEGVWRRAVRWETRHRIVPTLCPEDQLLHLALHAAKHAFIEQASTKEDVRRIVEHWRPSIAVAVERAHQWHATLALYSVLRHAAVPGLDSIRPPPLVERLLDELAGRDPTPLARLLGTVLAVEHRPNLGRFLLSYAGTRARDLWAQISPVVDRAP